MKARSAGVTCKFTVEMKARLNLQEKTQRFLQGGVEGGEGGVVEGGGWRGWRVEGVEGGGGGWRVEGGGGWRWSGGWRVEGGGCVVGGGGEVDGW